jgi:competence protein ComEC
MAFFNRAIDALATFLANQKQNYILWLPVLVAIGIAWYFGLSVEPQLSHVLIYFGVPCAIGVMAWIGITRHVFHNRISFGIACALIIYGLVCVGFIAGFTRTQLLQTNMITDDIGARMITGIISHVDHNQDTNTDIFKLNVISIDKMDAQDIPSSIRVSSRLKNVELKMGAKIQALIVLQPFKKPVSIHAYDFRRHYYFQGIGGMGLLLKPPVLLAHSQDSIGLTLIDWREKLRLKIEQILPTRSAGIVTALMTGERAKIDDTDWDYLRASGLAHIISISGLHVAMVATSIFFVVRLLLALIPFLALNFSIKKIAAFVALIGCILYVGFVVPTVPTTRSLLMTGVALIAILLDRSPFSLRLVSLSALAILIVLPESLWSASFQLSFAAVTLLVVMAELTRDHWNEWRKDAGFIRKILIFIGSSVATTIVATIATAPYSSFHFGQIANYSVIANGLSIPLAGIIIMPMLIISFLALPFHLEFWPLKLMGWGVDRMLDVAEYVAKLPNAVTLTPSWPFESLLFITIGGLLFCLIDGRARAVAIIPLFMAGFFIFNDAKQYLFISPEHKIIMVRDDQNNIAVSSLRRDKYVREEWLKDLGLMPDAPVTQFPKEGVVKVGEIDVGCERGACRITTPVQKISFGTDHKILFEDCGWADMIITEKYFTPTYDKCPATIYDRTRVKSQNRHRPWIF